MLKTSVGLSQHGDKALIKIMVWYRVIKTYNEEPRHIVLFLHLIVIRHFQHVHQIISVPTIFL